MSSIKVRWSEEEDALLRECQNVDEYMTKALERGYPFRTYRAVQTRRWSQGLAKPRLPFTPEEDEIIRRYYESHKSSGVAAVLDYIGKPRSRESIIQRANAMGLRHQARHKARAWSGEEEELLIDIYPWKDDLAVQEELRSKGYPRTLIAIQQKAYSLGIEKGVDYYNS